MKTFNEQLAAEIGAHTGVTICQNEDEERIEHLAQKAAEDKGYDFWTWSLVTGLQCRTRPDLTPTGEEAAILHDVAVLLGYVLNWTNGAAVLVAHDLVSWINHQENGGPITARMFRNITQVQKAINAAAIRNDPEESDEHKIDEAFKQMHADMDELKKAHKLADARRIREVQQRMIKASNNLPDHTVPRANRVVQLVVCDSEEMPRPCGADAIDLEMPDRKEAGKILDAFVQDREVPEFNRDQVLDAVAGLAQYQIEKALLLTFVHAGQLDPQQIAQYKKRALRARGITWIDPDPRGFKAVGGLEPLKRWLRARMLTFDRKMATEYNVEPAKGLIVSGPPGNGKSALFAALATEVASKFGSCTAVSLDIGATRHWLSGRSEQHLREALRCIDALGGKDGAPCVVLVDEADRGLAGSTSSGELDSGVSGRVFQTLLTWMQERGEKSNVFLYMTSNHPETLPAELTRSGRLDGMFWVNFPGSAERRSIVEIYKNHYKRAGSVDVDAVVKTTEDRSGAELEAAFAEAAIQALSVQAEQITTSDIIQALDTLPKTKDTFQMTPGMQAWKDAAVKANSTNTIDLVDGTALMVPQRSSAEYEAN